MLDEFEAARIWAKIFRVKGSTKVKIVKDPLVSPSRTARAFIRIFTKSYYKDVLSKITYIHYIESYSFYFFIRVKWPFKTYGRDNRWMNGLAIPFFCLKVIK